MASYVGVGIEVGVEAESLPTRHFMLGDKPTIGLRDVRSSSDGVLTGTTGTVSIYNSAGTVLSGANGASMTMVFTSSNTRVKASFSLTTGTSMIITTTGTYRAVYKLTFPDGTVKNWQQKIVVDANPY